MIKKLRDWYQGKYIPPENDPNSVFVWCYGYYERPKAAKIVGKAIRFWRTHWRWIITTVVFIWIEIKF